MPVLQTCISVVTLTTGCCVLVLRNIKYSKYAVTSHPFSKWDSGIARTFWAHGQRTLRGPSPYFITLGLFLWPLPLGLHPYPDFAHVYLIYMILNTALINQYISHGERFENLGPFDDAMGEMGVPWWRNDKWDPLITWWVNRGHNGAAMTQWPLYNVMEN